MCWHKRKSISNIPKTVGAIARVRGFTLLELLAVIAIIGLLAAVISASLNESRQKARAVTTVQQLTALERVMQLYALQENRNTWWHHDDIGSGRGQKTFEHLIENEPGFGFFLRVAPKSVHGSSYLYYNEGRPLTCNRSNSFLSGVNVKIGEFADFGLFSIMDEIIDGSDGVACGRLRMGGRSNSLYYSIGRDLNDL